MFEAGVAEWSPFVGEAAAKELHTHRNKTFPEREKESGKFAGSWAKLNDLKSNEQKNLLEFSSVFP